jgi:DNA-binding transcriptional ArsR family regulator
MGFEEDTYTTIFKAMQHPIRRRILRMIGEKPSTYTEIQRDLNIDNGLLNYHLDALSSLITKNSEEKYTLSDFGVATASLIKGVEEPNKVVPAVSAQPRLKWVAAVLTVALIVSGMGLLELNNRYIELSGNLRVQEMQILHLQAALFASEASLSKLNATLITLEKNPLVKASTMIIDAVGLDYFNRYFHDPTVKTPYISTNDTSVVFKYRIEVNDYTLDYDVGFYFTKDYVLVYGIPLQDNLQPFNVSAADAKRLALEAGLFESSWGSRVEIVGYFGYDLYPLPQYAEKYVWQVTSYMDPPWARTRMCQYALVDPITGEVYKTNGRGVEGLAESQVDTAAEAKAQGIEGYVRLHYSELPQQIQIISGGNLTFTIRVSFTSYNSSLREVKLIVDPQYVDPYMPSGMGDELRNYLSYSPNGTITIRAGESVNLTATIRAPDNVGQVFFFHRYNLDGLGIGAEGVLILSDLEA